MSKFPEPLILKLLDTEKDAKRFVVFAPFVYFIDKPDGDVKVKVPAGFKTDFASVPRLLWSVLPPVGLYSKAAVVHDYLCEHGVVWMSYAEDLPPLWWESANSTCWRGWRQRQITRREADRIFRDSMKVLGVGWLRRNIMFAGARLYSILTFKK